MRRYRKPLPAPARPDVGVTAIPLLPVGRGVAGAGVDDRDISENAYFDILHCEAADRHRTRGLCKELVPVDERSVGVRAQEILGQDFVEPLYITMLHRMDVVAVERRQRIKVALGCGVCLHGTS